MITWAAAQQQLDKNMIKAVRNTKYNYLMQHRARCGKCGHAMCGRTKMDRDKLYSYYHCNSYPSRTANGRCGSPGFRADRIDSAVWQWVESFLADPAALARGLDAYQKEREQENAPIRERLAVIDGLLTDNRAQLGRLLDLYLSGNFPREMLVDRKSRLEMTVEALEKEQVSLAAQLEAQTLTIREILSLQEFAAEVAEGLEAAAEDFGARQSIIEALGVQVTLAVEAGQQVAYARCMLGEKVLSVVNTTI
jgi:uncharacterized low-complexity protein